MEGIKFERLTVLSYLHTDKHKQRIWQCECECGNVTTVSTHSLRSGNTKSCGCYKSEKAAKVGRKVLSVHSLSKEFGKKTRLFRIWTGMKTRCLNSNNKAYPRYGGRGIKICPEWNSFKTFHDWSISNGYSDSLSIDRINNNSDYAPANCKWSTAKEQANNRRNNKSINV